jgi:hypothetical protein
MTCEHGRFRGALTDGMGLDSSRLGGPDCFLPVSREQRSSHRKQILPGPGHFEGHRVGNTDWSTPGLGNLLQLCISTVTVSFVLSH